LLRGFSSTPTEQFHLKPAAAIVRSHSAVPTIDTIRAQPETRSKQPEKLSKEKYMPKIGDTHVEVKSHQRASLEKHRTPRSSAGFREGPKEKWLSRKHLHKRLFRLQYEALPILRVCLCLHDNVFLRRADDCKKLVLLLFGNVELVERRFEIKNRVYSASSALSRL
jgi:hypothetical protein